MKKKVVISALLLALVPLTGCKKIQAMLPRNPLAKHVEAKHEQAATPTSTPVAVATPTPGPTINKNASVIVLCYHNIDDKGSRALTISIEEFEKQMQALKDNGFSVIGMQDFLAFRRGEKNIPPKCVIITLDDGWNSAYENAWPILKKYGYPFTLFIYVNYVNSGGKSMTWDQLAEMRDGGVDIECHTFTHGDLRSPLRRTSVDKKTMGIIENDIKTLGMDGWMRKEIVEAKQVLEKQLGIKCNAFAYPFGNFNQKARDLVKEAGYEAAFTVYGRQLHFSSPSFDQLGRYAIDGTQPQVFYTQALKMIGGGDVASAAVEPAYAQLAAASMITQPMDGTTISDPKPLIKANIATMGDIDPASIEMRVSGFGVVPAKYDAPTKTISYQVTQKLRDKVYTVILAGKADGKRVETRWTFNFDPTGKVADAAKGADLQLPEKVQ